MQLSCGEKDKMYFLTWNVVQFYTWNSSNGPFAVTTYEDVFPLSKFFEVSRFIGAGNNWVRSTNCCCRRRLLLNKKRNWSQIRFISQLIIHQPTNKPWMMIFRGLLRKKLKKWNGTVLFSDWHVHAWHPWNCSHWMFAYFAAPTAGQGFFLRTLYLCDTSRIPIPQKWHCQEGILCSIAALPKYLAIPIQWWLPFPREGSHTNTEVILVENMTCSQCYKRFTGLL